MSSVANKLRLVDDASKYLVNGYIRDKEETIINCYVPVIIIDLCLLYYFEYDKWDKERIGDGLKLNDNNCIIQTRDNDYH